MRVLISLAYSRPDVLLILDSNALLITDATIVSTVEKLASTKSHLALEEQYSFPKVVRELVNLIAFLSSDCQEGALSEIRARASEQLSSGSDLGTPNPQRFLRGYLGAVFFGWLHPPFE